MMKISLTGGCLAGWGVVAVFLLSFILGVRWHGAFHPLHCQSPQLPPLHSPHSPRIPPLSVPIRLCYKCLNLNPWQQLCPPSFAKWHIKFSNLICCSSTLSTSPEASRVVDICMSFSNLSSYSNFLTQISASSQASVFRQTAHRRGQTTAAATIHFPSVLQCAMCSSSNKHIKPAGVFRVPYTHVAVCKHLTFRPPLPTQRQMGNSGFSLQIPLSQDPFIQILGWLANC